MQALTDSERIFQIHHNQEIATLKRIVREQLRRDLGEIKLYISRPADQINLEGANARINLLLKLADSLA